MARAAAAMAPSGDARPRLRGNTVDIAAPRRRHPERLMTPPSTPPRPSRTPRRARARRGSTSTSRSTRRLRAFMTDTLVRVGRIDVADAADRDAGAGPARRSCSVSASPTCATRTTSSTPRSRRASPPGRQRIADEHVEHVESIAALREEAAALRGAAPTTPQRRWRCACTATWRSSSPRTSSTCTSRRRSTTPCSGSTTATPSSARCTAGCWRASRPGRAPRWSRAGCCRRRRRPSARRWSAA